MYHISHITCIVYRLQLHNKLIRVHPSYIIHHTCMYIIIHHVPCASANASARLHLQPLVFRTWYFVQAVHSCYFNTGLFKTILSVYA